MLLPGQTQCECFNTSPMHTRCSSLWSYQRVCQCQFIMYPKYIKKRQQCCSLNNYACKTQHSFFFSLCATGGAVYPLFSPYTETVIIFQQLLDEDEKIFLITGNASIANCTVTTSPVDKSVCFSPAGSFSTQEVLPLFLLLLLLPLCCICLQYGDGEKLPPLKDQLPWFFCAPNRVSVLIVSVPSCQVPSCQLCRCQFFLALFSRIRTNQDWAETHFSPTNHRSLTPEPLITRKRFGKRFGAKLPGAKLPSFLVPVFPGTVFKN
jgi:hypothetical protein